MATIDKLRTATHAAMKDPSFGEALTQMGFDSHMLSSTELAARIKSETDYWGSNRQGIRPHHRRLSGVHQ